MIAGMRPLCVACALLLCGCTSAEDKARIRQVVTAYEAASRAHPDTSDALMRDLQRAVDVVPDGKAREDILRCQHLLTMYALKERGLVLDLKKNLLDIGDGRHTTQKDFDLAKAKAQKENPLPDYGPISECAVITLPALAR